MDGLVVGHTVEKVENGVVAVAESTSRAGEVLRVDRASLRFLDVAELNGFLAEAGFTIEGQHGDWTRGSITARSRSIVTVAATSR